MEKTKIVILDTSKNNLKIYKDIFKHKLFEVIYSNSCNELLKLVKNKFVPHIIIINKTCCDCDAYDFVIELKLIKHLLNTTFILIVDKLTKAEYYKGLSLGVFKFLEDPVDKEELLIHINYIISMREVQVKIINEVLEYLKGILIENTKVEKHTKFLKEIISGYEYIPQTIKQLSKINEETSESTFKILEKVDQIYELVDIIKKAIIPIKNDNNYKEQVDQIESALDRLDTLTLDIITYSQFQDITSQQINYANSIINNIEKLLGKLLSYFGEKVLTVSKLNIEGTFDPKATIRINKVKQAEIDNLIKMIKDEKKY